MAKTSGKPKNKKDIIAVSENNILEQNQDTKEKLSAEQIKRFNKLYCYLSDLCNKQSPKRKSKLGTVNINWFYPVYGALAGALIGTLINRHNKKLVADLAMWGGIIALWGFTIEYDYYPEGNKSKYPERISFLRALWETFFTGGEYSSSEKECQISADNAFLALNEFKSAMENKKSSHDYTVTSEHPRIPFYNIQDSTDYVPRQTTPISYDTKGDEKSDDFDYSVFDRAADRIIEREKNVVAKRKRKNKSKTKKYDKPTIA